MKTHFIPLRWPSLTSLLALGRRSGIKATLLGTLAVMLLCTARAHAQTYSIDWHTIDGGGGTSSGGAFSVTGTIGQTDANPQPLTGGSFSLAGGFWVLLAVQTPGAPSLTVRLTSTNTVVVMWPSPSAGFTLQEKNALDTTNWIATPETALDNGSNKFVIVNPPAGNRVYRLFKP